MDPKSLYLQHLASIDRIARSIARRRFLSPDQCDDFVQIVHLRLIEDDYAILGKFEGRSQITTYLTTVIGRLYCEWRTNDRGKWRPSAEARRLGDTAITLERMLTRDGFTRSEAFSTLTTRSGAPASLAELEAIYARLPPRNPRPEIISGEVSPDAASVPPDADDRLASADRERVARLIAETIDAARASLAPEDRFILQLRFWKGYKVREIAEVLNFDTKKMFKRLDKLYAVLRRALEAAGLDSADIAMVLGRGDH
jgi:RNA polymerase sigma factor (sigma-70 family)